ncbi:MAG: MBL fold metallo-hydrolase [Desulfurococcales archaeon]|nr:MBL fold metallo-hydrolase [Desulfurococcales archaeon]MCE4605056.1 MBL fold metallo-hydrolase [Desulfurococcales archaeon]
MRIRVIAADSMGVRSIATVVEACGHVVGIDLGAALGPRRYGLPPHPIELKRLEESLDSVYRWILDSDIVIITHYHYDHYVRDRPDLYKGKVLLVKNPVSDINRSQRLRAYRFLRKNGVEDLARVHYADGSLFRFGKLEIEFSKPLWHGEEGTKLGKVLMVLVRCEGESFVFASDVQGPMNSEALEVLESWGGDVVLMDGPPTYFAGYKVSRESVDKGLEYMLELVSKARPRTLIVDHHLIRDLGYRNIISRHLEAASRAGVSLVTAAEFMGIREEPLEAMRKELWRSRSSES